MSASGPSGPLVVFYANFRNFKNIFFSSQNKDPLLIVSECIAMNLYINTNYYPLPKFIITSILVRDSCI